MPSRAPVALVTGSSRGIGFSVAKRLVSQGCRVCLTGRGPEALATAVTALGGDHYAMAMAGRADDAAHQEGTIRAVLDRFGQLDVLVNNAGINPVYGPLMDADLDAARKVLEVNLLSSLRWTQLAYRAWMRDNGGSIVNISSVTGVTAASGLGVYGVSKAALIALTRQLGEELAPNVRVNAVAPGVIRTDFSRALYESDEARVTATYPMRRLGEPADIAGVVTFLTSDDAAWLTGQTIVVDGGLTLGGRL